MNKIESELEDDLRSDYDLRSVRVRKIGPGRRGFGDVVRLEPDVANAFPDAESVNEALRFLIRITKDNRSKLGHRRTMPNSACIGAAQVRFL